MAKGRVTIDFRQATKEIKQFKLKAKGRAVRVLETEITKSILRGVSPVDGVGRFQKYSESYKAQIRGELAFFTKGGKIIPISALSNKELKSFRASKGAKAQNKANKNFIKDFTKNLKTKRVSPVNLKVTGELLNSLFVKATTRGVLIGFDNFLADIHNRLGAGKSKVVRRMLPTNPGERFNKTIVRKLRESLTNVAKQIFN